MSVLESTLLIAAALAIFIPFFWRLFQGLPRWVDFVPAALLALMLVQILVDGFQMYMIVVYILVVVLFLQTVQRMIRPGAPGKASRWRTVLALVGSLLGVVGLVVGIWAGPMMASGAGVDLSRESWTQAFERMNGILAQRYAFSEWKEMDWDALHAEFAPRIAAAEEANDEEEYHMALREYVYSIPDGHIKFSGDDMSLWRESIGGGYGLAVIELDDGSVIAHVVSEGGPVEVAGMTWGAEILEWDGVPAREALGQVAPIWLGLPPATEEGRRVTQQQLLTRAPAGTEVSITFQNHGEEEAQTATLTAIDDGLEPLYESLGWGGSEKLKLGMGEEVGDDTIMRPPEYRILPEGYGYLRVYHMIPEDADPDFVEIVEKAVTEFVAQDVLGVLIDVRSNPGGHDTLVAQMMGYFASEPSFYEYMYLDNWLTGLSILDSAIPVEIEPKEPRYGGPVAVLIDENTLSSGEGFPMVAKRLPQGRVVGIHGTYGSFGMCCSNISLPGGFAVQYPPGQSQDGDHRVQLDSDHTLQGGVVPDVRVPLTRDTVRAMYLDGEDVVLRYAMEALREE